MVVNQGLQTLPLLEPSDGHAQDLAKTMLSRTMSRASNDTVSPGLSDIDDSPLEIPSLFPGNVISDNSSPRLRGPLFRSSSSTFPSTPRRRIEHPVKDTPINKTVNGTKGSFPLNASSNSFERYADEAQDWVVGPMPVQAFLDEFLPPVKTRIPGYKKAFNAVPFKPKTERELYDPLIVAINDRKRCPSVKFFDTADHSERFGRGTMKPDISGYALDDVQSVERNKDGKLRANLGLTEIFIEVKRKDDPFSDHHEHTGLAEGETPTTFVSFAGYPTMHPQRVPLRRNLGQIVAYAAEACSRQHRLFYFSVLVVGTRARLLRWDRSGVIVTNSFDYQEDPKYLCEFLWRFHHASYEERGYDPSVIQATADEEILFRDVIKEEVAWQLGIDATVDPQQQNKLDEAVTYHYEEKKVTKVEVWGGQTIGEYLVSRPVKSPISMAGRSTRGYWAVKIVKTEGGLAGETCFLKDTWRIFLDDLDAEGRIHSELMNKHVKNISKVCAHGDVPDNTDEMEYSFGYINGLAESTEAGGEPGAYEDKKAAVDNKSTVDPQCTRTNDFLNASWNCSCLRKGKKVSKHIHYRMILVDVGYPLKEFTGSRELFEAASDVFEALCDAYEECRRLHRDVSLENIILVRCRKSGIRKAILIDWEFSCLVNRDGKARDYHRSGTWAYMSAACLERRNRHFQHAIEDDLESLFYVVMRCSLLWLPHNKYEPFGQWMYDFFDSISVYGGVDSGGKDKNVHLMCPEMFTETFKFDNPHIQTWFTDVYKHLRNNARFMRTAGEEVPWPTGNIRALFGNVLRGLSSLPRTENDRVKHVIANFHKEVVQERCATHSQLASSSKRLLGDVRDNEGVKMTESKRRRVDTNEGQTTSNSVAREDSEPHQNRRYRNLRVSNVAPKGGSGGTIARQSGLHRQKSRTSSLGERRSARLAAKASSTSLKRGQ